MSDFEKRLERLMSKCSKNEAFLITDDINIYYYTSVPDSCGSLFVTKDTAYFFVDFRYGEIARKTAYFTNVIVFSDYYASLNDVISKENTERIYIENNNMTVSVLDIYKSKIKC
ncbi:MAG: aminopeptidase P family N-terminal domain-containing protein, partial [Acutalibacteraceae bacterium]